MATQKKFPVADFTVPSGVLKQAQRNALVRGAMMTVVSVKAGKKPVSSAAKKSRRKAK